MNDPNPEPIPGARGAMSLGLEMAVPIALFGYFGYRLDRRLGSEPAGLLGGGLLGVVVAMYSFYKRVRMMTPSPPKQDRGRLDGETPPDRKGPTDAP